MIVWNVSSKYVVSKGLSTLYDVIRMEYISAFLIKTSYPSCKKYFLVILILYLLLMF